MQNIEKLLENKNFLNNQNYVLSVKNKYSLYGSKQQFIMLHMTVSLFVLVILILIIFLVLNNQSYILSYILNELRFILIFPFVLIICFLWAFLVHSFFNFLSKGKKYIFLKKNPTLENLSLNNENYNINNFFIIKLTKNMSLFENFKNNIVVFMFVAFVSCILAIPINLILTMIIKFLILIYNEHYIWIVAYIVSVIIVYIIMSKNNYNINKILGIKDDIVYTDTIIVKK